MVIVESAQHQSPDACIAENAPEIEIPTPEQQRGDTQQERVQRSRDDDADPASDEPSAHWQAFRTPENFPGAAAAAAGGRARSGGGGRGREGGIQRPNDKHLTGRILVRGTIGKRTND